MPKLAQIKHNPPSHENGIGLYVHIPFCQTKCSYCDFNTYERIEGHIPDYVTALTNEIEAWSDLLSQPVVHTVFLGGGTPSYLPVDKIKHILSTIHSSYQVYESAEITLECNPGDITLEGAYGWSEARVNRVSMGVQSFNDDLLGLLGRRHTATEAKQAFHTLRKAGFKNVSIDLIYGLPYQSASQWSDTLNEAVDLGSDHISLYSLQIEEGTPLAVDVNKGRYPTPDDDLAAEMYEEAQRKLTTNGFTQYEISNWAKPGMESQHNIIYWLNEPYLGVGAGAHSWLDGQRFFNLKSPTRYVTAMDKHRKRTNQSPVATMQTPFGPVEQVDVTTTAIDISETMMMGMRLNSGVSHKRFEKRFGTTLNEVFSKEMDRLATMDLIEITDEGVRLSDKGRLLGNEVFAEFISDQ
ncbi:MAG: radical SAM family heme chaperone HemW [SAR202 cluster bacterium]|nr:radical SAM family heme chaperone HemW [SAR202 cluster bacterium]|tara:strand:+ start:20345 stop:21574 length:1230 start_codon:yes stop_codon:yes gene_type:complete